MSLVLTNCFFLCRAGRLLPKNFEQIALSKQLIEKLSGLGIVYDTLTGTREDAVYDEE